MLRSGAGAGLDGPVGVGQRVFQAAAGAADQVPRLQRTGGGGLRSGRTLAGSGRGRARGGRVRLGRGCRAGGATGAARARGCSGSGGVRRCGYGSGCWRGSGYWRSSGHWCGRARRSRCRFSCGRVFRCRVCCGKIVRVRITCDVYHRRGGQGYRRVVTREKRGRRAIGGPFDHQIPHLQHRDLRAPVVTASTATGAQRQCGEAQGQGVGKMCLLHDGRAAWGVSARKTAGQSGRETERRKKEFTNRHGLVWCAQQTVPSGVQRP